MARGRAANGSGNIRRRKDGTYEARFTIGRDPGTGKLDRRSVYGKTVDEVRKKLTAATAAVDDKTYIEPEKRPLKWWLETWMAEYTGGVKPGTLKTYGSNIRLYILPRMGALRLCEIQPHDCQSFINRLHREVNGLSPKTVKNIHGVLHMALKTAVKVGYIRSNSAAGVALPRIEKEEIKPLSGQEIDDFLAVIKGNPSESLLFIALFTGMRLSELLGLQWKCVDFKQGTIKINKQLLLKRGKDTQRTLGPPKNDKPRTIKPPQAVLDTLKAVRKQQTAWRLAAGPAWRNVLDLVFTNEIGDSIPHATAEHRYKRVVTAIGLPDRRFHDLRHPYVKATTKNF